MVAPLYPQTTTEAVRSRASSRASVHLGEPPCGDMRAAQVGTSAVEAGVATTDRGLQMLRLLNSLFNGWNGRAGPPAETA